LHRIQVVPTHDSALPIGHRLDEYLITRLLGHGGFGLTYLAQDTNLNAFVAIKEFLPSEFAVRGSNSRVMPRSDTDNDSYRWGLDRFKDEARALARFKHPNIVRAARLLEANGTAYMVMDFEPGMTLSQYLKRHGPVIDEGHLLGIFLPVLDGLEALHTEQLVHRDIKPGNIYLRAKGGPMLIDFGAVRQAIGAHTRSLTSLVTPGYAPIEQYSVDGRQGAWTDLYAMGATMYYCMFGQAPADATRRSAAMSDDSRDPYLSARSKNQGRYSKELVEAVDWALHFRARDRPQAAHELRERLARSPVTPLITTLPESVLDVPVVQDGKITNQDSRPGAATSLDPLFALPDSAARPRTSLNNGEATQPAVGALPYVAPTQLPTDRAAAADIAAATGVNRGPLLVRLHGYIAARRKRLHAQMSEPPTTVAPENTAMTLGSLWRSLAHKPAYLGLGAVLVMLVLAAVLTLVHRRSVDERLYAAAAATDTQAAYAEYLQTCAQCAHRADAETAEARLARAEKLAALKREFRGLLARGALTAPAGHNAGGVLHEIAGLAADDPDLPALRSALSNALTGALKHQPRAAKLQPTKPPAHLAQAETQKQPQAQSDNGEPVAQPLNPLRPKYPQSARAYGKAGWVEVDFMVQIDGSASDVQVLAAQPKSIFDQAAMHAIFGVRFKPYTDGGTPERKRMRLKIEFKP
jgi:TonB family protein